MKSSVQRELFRQINKVIISKTNKPKTSAFRKVPKSKYQCSTSTEKVKNIYAKTESEDTKMH